MFAEDLPESSELKEQLGPVAALIILLLSNIKRVGPP